jgi:tRNA(fMet)-specific endonuclease VapC
LILLDTDICIEILRKNQKVLRRREQYDEVAAISFMSVAELYYGAEKSKDPAGNRNLIEEFMISIEILQTDLPILQRFGALKFQLYNSNIMLPDADIMIAATAYEKADRLITGNLRHFDKFPNLAIESWR